jgi:hypothetical protein
MNDSNWLAILINFMFNYHRIINVVILDIITLYNIYSIYSGTRNSFVLAFVLAMNILLIIIMFIDYMFYCK